MRGATKLLVSLSRLICIALLLTGPIMPELGNLERCDNLNISRKELSGESWSTILFMRSILSGRVRPGGLARPPPAEHGEGRVQIMDAYA